MRVAGHVLNLRPWYMGDERRSYNPDDFKRYLEEHGTFDERRGSIGVGPGGGNNKTFMAVLVVGAIALTQAVNFINDRVLSSAFSRDPQFTQQWKETIDQRLVRYEMQQQSHEGKLALQDGRLQAQDNRLQAIERKLDALLWKAQIDPETLRGR